MHLISFQIKRYNFFKRKLFQDKLALSCLQIKHGTVIVWDLGFKQIIYENNSLDIIRLVEDPVLVSHVALLSNKIRLFSSLFALRISLSFMFVGKPTILRIGNRLYVYACSVIFGLGRFPTWFSPASCF